jgi:PncC family amidohydrolase
MHDMDLKKLIQLLSKHAITVATAESISAGYLSYLLTKTPGSSKVFKGGSIVYSLESKHRFFGISPVLLRKTKGVSKKIALLLAIKVRSLYKVDIGLAIVGFAGPTKSGEPAGKVYISASHSKGAFVRLLHLKGNRDSVRKQAAHAALALLAKILCEHSSR